MPSASASLQVIKRFLCVLAFCVKPFHVPNCTPMTPPPFLVEYRPMIRTVKDKITEIADKIQQSDDYELRVGYVVYR